MKKDAAPCRSPRMSSEREFWKQMMLPPREVSGGCDREFGPSATGATEGFWPEEGLHRAVWWTGCEWQGQRVEAGRPVSRLPQGSLRGVRTLGAGPVGTTEQEWILEGFLSKQSSHDVVRCCLWQVGRDRIGKA